jgi:hypothetical protein
MKTAWILISAAALATLPPTALGDSTDARCDVYPAGSDRASKMIGCAFSQRQGYVTIRRADGTTHDLSPVADRVGEYFDGNGHAVSRETGLGDQGLIFRFPDESVYVYWSTAALDPDRDGDNPTAPFSTRDYDATTLLRCRASGSEGFGNCPAGILRMEGGQASIVVLSPADEQFTINFMRDYVNATNREVDARLEGDTWFVTVDGSDIYQVPLAAIEGG